MGRGMMLLVLGMVLVGQFQAVTTVAGIHPLENQPPRAVVMGLTNGDLAVIDLTSGEIYNFVFEGVESFNTSHYFPRSGMLVMVAWLPERTCRLLLFDLNSAEISLSDVSFPGVWELWYSLRNPDLLFVGEDLSAGMGDFEHDRLSAEPRDPLLAFDVVTHQWTDVHRFKKQLADESFPFHRQNYNYEYFNLPEWQKLKDNKIDVPRRPYQFGHLKYEELCDLLYNRGIIDPMIIKGKLDTQPILYWGQRYLLCRSGGGLIVVEYQESGKNAEIVRQVPTHLIMAEPRLLTPSTVDCIFDGRVMDNFIRRMKGTRKRLVRHTTNYRRIWRTPPDYMVIPLMVNWLEHDQVFVQGNPHHDLHHLHLEYRPGDQPNGQFIPGIALKLDNSRELLRPDASCNLPFSLRATEKAPGHGRIILRIVSDEGEWGLATVNYYIAPN